MLGSHNKCDESQEKWFRVHNIREAGRPHVAVTKRGSLKIGAEAVKQTTVEDEMFDRLFVPGTRADWGWGACDSE